MGQKERLLGVLKDKGLNIAEDQVAALVESVFELAEAVIKESDNKFDDLLLVAFPQVKSLLLDQVDKIDGEDDK